MSMATNPGWHRGDWMQTFTGRKFYPMAPTAEDVDPVDIAHALSMLCRYAGHVDRFYSVAEHCVLLSGWARDHGHDERVQLEMLLHDATEAYVVDVPRPLKVNLPDYQRAERGVELVIAERFGLPMVDGRYGAPQIVKHADTRILLDERAALMAATVHAWGVDSLEPLGVVVEGWDPSIAEQHYLGRLAELTDEGCACCALIGAHQGWCVEVGGPGTPEVP